MKMMPKVLTAFTAIVLLMSAAKGDSLKSMTVASELGAIIASEEFCDLAFDQAAIEAFIEKHVDAADTGFAPTMNMMVESQKFQLNEMKGSAKTAHCAQIRRSAKVNHLIQ
ncbi:signal recognition particle [Phyllobacterium salinisoli]|uniref:Signal recognition particle n=1 Tax=Phyllobacterium salinisoli TaxID=1899321 RepID=A0A368JYV6_9HYPH|nr:signal recognition particle [Phyllobacterium salinisoli]RCS21373.1 signal recognition particle [Phyllobacterium salinisoli]